MDISIRVNNGSSATNVVISLSNIPPTNAFAKKLEN